MVYEFCRDVRTGYVVVQNESLFRGCTDQCKIGCIENVVWFSALYFAYFFLPISHIESYIGVMFLLFCLPPAANIVALETHYQGTGISAKYIASGTIVSCVVCVMYGVVIHFL